MQSMLFDQNAATKPHQDWWYLDSRPAGQLLAAWIALEDIDQRAGRFYLMPRTTALRPLDPDPLVTHSEWLLRIRRLLDDHLEQVHTPAMRRGDVIL